MDVDKKKYLQKHTNTSMKIFYLTLTLATVHFCHRKRLVYKSAKVYMVERNETIISE